MANILDSIRALTLSQKITYLIVLGGSIAALIALTFWAQQPEYHILFSNLSPDDAGQIVSRLKDRKIPYKVEAGGSVISIPAENVYETRLELAGNGLPQGGSIGFEIFDRTNLGMTEFTQKVNYKRALQGELSRTIKGLSEVQDAKVHLVLPEKSLFLEDEQKARASVVVNLKTGKKLSQNQVQGIVHLVASSVEGLSPESVTVVNTMGQMLTRASDGSETQAMTSSQMEYQKGIEKDIETRLQSMIEKVVGVNKVSASVSADIEFKRVEKTEERYDPDGQVVRSEQRTQEKSTGEGMLSGGVPGVASNVPGQGTGAQTAQAATLPATAQRQNETINYEINKVISRIVEPTGAIKRLSVAVLVDGTYEVLKDTEGKEERKYIPRTAEEMAKIENLVKGAVGFTSERGDRVTVVSIPFDTGGISAEEVAVPEPSIVKEYLHYAFKYGTALLLVLLIIFFVVRPLLYGMAKKGEVTVEEIQKALPGTVAELEAQFGGEKALAGGVPQAHVINRLVDLARQNPQQTAQIIRGWLK